MEKIIYKNTDEKYVNLVHIARKGKSSLSRFFRKRILLSLINHSGGKSATLSCKQIAIPQRITTNYRLMEVKRNTFESILEKIHLSCVRTMVYSLSCHLLKRNYINDEAHH